MVSPDRPSPRSPDAQFTVQFDHCKVSWEEGGAAALNDIAVIYFKFSVAVVCCCF